MTKYFGHDLLYIPDTLSSGKRVVSETDFTHKMSRLRGFVIRGKSYRRTMINHMTCVLQLTGNLVYVGFANK